MLEQRTFRRVGGLRDLTSDARVIAATNRNLDAAVKAGAFREDLLYRLKVFPIEVPPLRARKEDILPLAEALLESLTNGRRPPVILDEESRSLLVAHVWPGNVRELRNVLERALILAEGPTIDAECLPEEVREPRPVAAAGRLAEQEVLLIQQALADSSGHLGQAASRLGIGRDALRRRMKKLGIVGEKA